MFRVCRPVIQLLSGVCLAVLLTGCGASVPTKLNPFKKEEVKLPGERIAVLKSQDGFKVDDTVAKRPVVLSQAQRNVEWSQPGGVASNAPGHLEFGGALGASWRADIGSAS